MTSPIVYSWQDVGAPVALGGSEAVRARGLYDILKACLVDGYGDKPAASATKGAIAADGWKVEFEVSDNHHVWVIQGGDSSRPRLHTRFYPQSTYGVFTSYSYVIPVGVEAGAWNDLMVDATDAKPLIYPKWFNRVASSEVPSGYVIPWYLFATKRSMFLFFGSNSSSYSVSNNFNSDEKTTCFFIGDYKSVHPSPVYNQMQTATWTSSLRSHDLTHGIVDHRIHVSGAGTNFMQIGYANAIRCRAINLSSFTDNRNEFYIKYPSPMTNSLYLQSIPLVYRQNIIGEIPGARYSLFQKTHTDKISPPIITDPDSGDVFYVFGQNQGSAAHNIYISTGDWGVD